jgi:HEAT repeat protein
MQNYGESKDSRPGSELLFSVSLLTYGSNIFSVASATESMRRNIRRALRLQSLRLSSTTAAIQVTEFVQALALSWKTLAAYPTGHPALIRALDLVDRRLGELRGPAGDVTLGVSKDGLIYGDLKIDSMAARKFGEALFSRGVAIIHFSSDTNAHDIEQFLRLMGSGSPANRKTPLWEDLTAAGVIAINLQPVSYAEVRLTDTLDPKRPAEREGSLWDEILRALLEGRRFSEQSETPVKVDSADELTRIINEFISGSKTTFDPDATFGVRLAAVDENAFHDLLSQTVGSYISNAWGMKKQNSLQQAIQLIQTLAQPLRSIILRAVVEALASDEQAGMLMRELASELPSDEVLGALRYLSAADKLSSHAMSLLEVLTQAQEAKRASRPSPTIIADLVRVFGDEDISRFNPADHAALLASVVVHFPQIPAGALTAIEKLGSRADTMDHSAIVRQFATMLLLILADVGPSRAPQPVLNRIETIFRSFVNAGDFDDARELTQQLHQIADETTSESLRREVREAIGRFVTAETIHDLIENLQGSPPEKAAAIERLTESLGINLRHNLLVALAEENNRSRRRRLFDFVASLGKEIVPEVVSFLGDSRWYVLRNMLVLLRMLEDRTSLPAVSKLTRHPDQRVKFEAIKTLFALGGEVPGTLLDDLINDPDPKLADTAISLIGSYGITEGVDPLLRVLQGNDVLGARRSLRVKALRALGELRQPRAIEHLQRFFSHSLLPWPSREERLAAWQSLQNYPPETRQEIVRRGLRSRNPQIRAICERLSRS